MNRITQLILGVNQNVFRQVAVVCCLLFMGGMAFGQVDDFTDGNFTTSPAWSGNTSDFSIETATPYVSAGASTDGSYLASSISAGNITLTTPSNVINEWKFSLGTGGFSPASTNYFGVILMSSVAVTGSITGTSWNGYYLKIGVNGTTDPIELWVKNGTGTGTKVGDFPTSPNYNGNALLTGLNIRVTRSASGVFELFYSTGFTYAATPTTSAGTLTNNTITTSSFFGVYSVFANPSAARRLFLDNLLLGTVPTPTISTTGTLSAVSTTYGSASATPTSFSVSGANMTAGILVTPPVNFEVSLTEGSGYANTITVGAAGTIISTPVFLRLKSTATVAGSPYSGDIVLSSTGATAVNVATASSTVTPLARTVSNAVASDKVYDATNTATFTGGVATGVNGDVISVTGGGTFEQTSVGTSIPVTPALSLTGTNASSYLLTQPTGLSAAITARPLTITGVTALNKSFDNTTTATLSGTAVLNGVIASDVSNVTLGGTPSATFDSSAVGTGIAVTVTGYAISGTAAGNYSLTQPTGLSANIVAAAVPSITSALSRNLTYGDVFATYTITATNSPTSFSATTLPAGLDINTTNGEITGTPTVVGTFNVTIAATNGDGTGEATLVITITPKTLTVTSAIADSKVYNKTTAATIAGSTLNGIVGADAVTISNTGTFANALVGAAKVVTSTQILGGADAAKYALTVPTGLTASITPKALTIAGAAAQNKEFDNTTTATITGTLTGVEAGDSVTLSLTGTFASSAIANAIEVTSISTLGGADAGNYTLTQPTGLTANITAPTPAPILQWNTFGNAGTETTESSVFNNSNLAASTLTQGGGVSPTGNSNRFGGNNWFNTGDASPSTVANAVAGNDYIQFIVTPNAGFSFTPTAFTFGWDRSTSGPGSVALRSSADGFTSNLGTLALAASQTNGNSIAITGLTDLAAATTFRLYGYGATATTGTGGFDTTTNAVNVQLIGTTAIVPPSPALSITGFLQHGTSCTDTAASAITYTITNTGNAAATDISVGSSNLEFAVSALSATSIAPAASATYVVTFTPSSTGEKTATISISSTNTTTLTNSLSGTGINNAPSLNTNTADNVQTTSARLRATNVIFGCPTTTVKGFVFAKTSDNADPVDGGTSVTNFPVTPLGLAQDFVSTQSLLLSETQYSYKAYLSDGTNYIYGAVQTFTTLSVLADEPTMQPTNAVISNVTITSMDVSWTAATTAPDGYIVTRRLGDVPTLAQDGTFYTIGQAIDANTTVAYMGSDLTAVNAALQSGSQYQYRIYAYNGSGTSVNYLTTGTLAINAYTLSLEPTAHPVTFTATAGTTSINLAFDAANTITNATGYLILLKTGSVPTGIPEDGLGYANNAIIGNATVVTTIIDAAATSFTAPALTPGQNYFFTIIPFGKAGTTAAFDGSSNYYTIPTIPSASAFLTNNSTIFAGVVGSEAATISSMQSDTAITNNTQGAKVWEFTISDGGATATDTDGLPTIITGLTISRVNSSVDFAGTIQTAAIFDASGILVATNSSSTVSSLIFSGLNITVPNNTTITYSLRISLKTAGNQAAFIDGSDIGFSISVGNVTTPTDATSSKIGTFSGVATPNNTNVVTVVASELRYVQNASNVNVNSPMAPSVVLEATDANGNRDEDFVSAITLTSTGTLTGVSAVVNAILGQATFPSLFHSAAGTGLFLNANAASFNPLQSASFDVLVGPGLIAGWDFTGTNNGNAATAAPGIVDPNLSTGILLTRGSGATGSTGSNSFRTTGFQNNGIALANTDYFETQLKANTGATLSLENIDARVTGTASFIASPGVSMQFAYSLDNVNFSLIGSPVVSIGEGSIPQIDLSGVTALQNVPSNTTVTLRFYASGQTSTGGFGFNSPSAGALGLQFAGLLTCIEPALFDVTSSGASCSSTTVGLSGSELGINYQLRNNGVNVGSSVPGTGSSLDFGLQNNAGTYSILASNTNGTCDLSQLMSGSIVLSNNTWTGTTNDLWNVATNWSCGIVPDGTTDIDITQGTPVLNVDFTLPVGRILTLSGTGVLTIAPTASLTITGIANFGGKSVILQSDASGAARIGQILGTLSNATNVTVERYIPAKRAWRLLTAPVRGTTNNSVFANWQNNGAAGDDATGLMLWDTNGTEAPTSGNTGLFQGLQANMRSYTAGVWSSVTNTNTTPLFTATENNAFLVFVTGPHASAGAITGAAVATTAKATGSLITGTVDQTLVGGQFKLIANPYASPISTAALVANNAGSKLWLIDPTVGLGAYVTYDGNWSLPPSDANAELIQSGQAFFVRTADASTFTINEADKVSGNSDNWFSRNATQDAPTATSDKIRVLLYKQEAATWKIADGALAVNQASGNTEVDDADARKINNFNESLMFRNGTTNLSIEYRALPQAGDVQQMRMLATTAIPYQLRVYTENYSNSTLQPYLEDTTTGALTAIPTDGSEVIVPFTGVVSNTTTPDLRFRIVYQTNLSTDAPSLTNVKVYPNPVVNGQLHINLGADTTNAKYTITNVLGQSVQQGELATTQNTISVPTLTKGMYILNITQEERSYTTKIYVH